MKENKNFHWAAPIIIVLIMITGLLIFVVSSLKNNTSEEVLETSSSTPFMDLALLCPQDTNTSDRYSCLAKLADKTDAEAKVLANKLISQAPIRLKEINTTNTGPVVFEYGGSDFLENLPILVKKTEKFKDDYITNICNLAAMNIYGGSGMDLEFQACRYFFINKYLEILKRLEAGVEEKN